ncbi:MAG: hypothetical protein JXR07_17605 [Reichenbachiella sp.]
MDDSNILYYLALAGIYIISRVLKKKKPVEEPVEYEESTPEAVSSPKPKRPSSVEDILKELSKEFTPQETEPIPENVIKPVQAKPTPLPDYQAENIEAIKPDEKIDIVPHKPIERKKPTYERSIKFEIEEEENEVTTEIRDFLAEQDGPKKAIILKEIFDRKY